MSLPSVGALRTPTRRTPARPGSRTSRWHRLRPELVVVVAAFVLLVRDVGRPSPWWDEAITLDVAGRTRQDIVDLTEHVDLVHLPYYLLVHAVHDVAPTLTDLRLVSVVAMALTAGLLVRLGRDLGSLGVGLTAAAAFTAAPLVTRYAQEARPYAMVTLLATASTVALVRACRRPWLRGRWVLYALLIVATGLMNILAGLVLLPHLAHVLTASPRVVWRRWATAAAGAAVPLTAAGLAVSGQRAQVAWLPTPTVTTLVEPYHLAYGWAPLLAILAGVGLAGWLRGTHRRAFLLGVTWAVLPVVTLWVVSQQVPLFDTRYVVFTLPGIALAVGALLPLLRPLGTVVAVGALVVSGWHMQSVYRMPAIGHAEDIRGAAALVAEGGRPGDAVLFLPASRRVVAMAYPEDFTAVDDVALARTPVQSATLWGVETSTADLDAALTMRHRIWVVTSPPRLGETPTESDEEKRRLLETGYRLASTWSLHGYDVKLYLSDAGPTVPAHEIAGTVRYLGTDGDGSGAVGDPSGPSSRAR